jgi:hypothetical protein
MHCEKTVVVLEVKTASLNNKYFVKLCINKFSAK